MDVPAISHLLVALTMAASPEPPPAATTYFAGDARIIDPFGGPEQSERVLLIRDIEPARSRIVERACVLRSGRPPTTSSVYIRINGEGLSVSDSEAGSGGAVTGTGRVVGDAWAWRELQFDMTYTGPNGAVRIADLNLMLPGRLLARKQISVPGGPVVQLWEAELTETPAATFREEWRRLGCPDG